MEQEQVVNIPHFDSMSTEELEQIIRDSYTTIRQVEGHLKERENKNRKKLWGEVVKALNAYMREFGDEIEVKPHYDDDYTIRLDVDADECGVFYHNDD